MKINQVWMGNIIQLNNSNRSYVMGPLQKRSSSFLFFFMSHINMCGNLLNDHHIRERKRFESGPPLLFILKGFLCIILSPIEQIDRKTWNMAYTRRKLIKNEEADYYYEDRITIAITLSFYCALKWGKKREGHGPFNPFFVFSGNKTRTFFLLSVYFDGFFTVMSAP